MVCRLTYQWKPSITQTVRFIKTAPPKLPSVRQLVWLLLKSKEKLTDEEKDFKQKILENSDEVRQGLGLLNKFRTMVREKKADKYEEWLKEAQNKSLTEFENFAKGLRRDNEAVKNALSEKWSNGQVEGQGATRSRINSCYDSLFEDITGCFAIRILPKRAALATARCEAFGTMQPYPQRVAIKA